MRSENLTWATISTVVGLVVAWVSIFQFVLAPLNERLETARDNVFRAMAERDARMDYLQGQIDELERRLGEKGQVGR